MVLYGLMAILQLTFLPGILVLRLLKFKSFLSGIMIAFGLSLLLNHLIIFFLTLLGLYNRPIFVAVFITEIVLIVFINRILFTLRIQALIDRIGRSIKKFYREYFFPELSLITPRLNFLQIFKAIAFLSALGFLISYIWIYGQQYNMVFTQWDAVVSWDRWAIDWFNGKLPTITWHYPQLIPTSWSLTYVFIGNSIIKQFARWFMGAFEIFIPLTLLIMGWSKRNAAFFWGCTVASWFVLRLGSQASGYVDTAVACLSLIAVGCLLLAQDEIDDRQRSLLVFFGLLISCAAALTKQAGIWTVVIYLVLYALYSRKNGISGVNRRQWLLLIASALLIVAPWYIYKQIQITLHIDQSELPTITSAVHAGRNYLERATFAYSELKEHLGYSDVQFEFLLVFIAILAIVSLKFQKIRWVTLLIIVPYVITWTFMLGYDERNLTYVYPFIGISIGYGVDWLITQACKLYTNHFGILKDTIYGIARRIFSVRLYIVGLLLVLAFALLPLRYNDEYLKQSSIDKQMVMGEIALNKQLYAYFDEHGFQGKILTDYMFLFGLPYIKDYYFLGYTRNLAYLQQLTLPDISYSLYCTNMASKELSQYMENKIINGEYKLIFQANCWNFVSLCKDSCQ